MKKIFRFFCLILCICLCGAGFHVKKYNGKAEISAGKAECVIECNSGRILYESHGDLRLPMASTTKILTAITVLEMAEDLQENVVIPPEAVGIEGSSVYLTAGDIYTVEELLYGLMLRSGNDCAVTLALFFGGTVSAFCSQMNLTAQKAGALDSSFVNPHGLPEKNHYTTARDLCYIARYAMQNPTFQRIVATKNYEKRQWHNKNKMLMECNGCIGIKTGYTKEAGRCLVSGATRDDMTVITCVLNCPSMYERSMALIDDAFATYCNTLILEKETVLPIFVKDKKTYGKVLQDYYYPLTEGEKAHLEIRTEALSDGKMQKTVGQFRIYLAKRLLFSGNLYKL